MPGWLVLGREAHQAGRLGPHDLRELIEDATRIALADQMEAGIDPPANGEMGWENFTLGFFGRLAGLTPLPVPRRWGVPNYDTPTPYQVADTLSAPEGLGLVDEWRMTRRLTDRPLRATCPGPYTLAIPSGIGAGPIATARPCSPTWPRSSMPSCGLSSRPGPASFGSTSRAS